MHSSSSNNFKPSVPQAYYLSRTLVAKGTNILSNTPDSSSDVNVNIAVLTHLCPGKQIKFPNFTQQQFTTQILHMGFVSEDNFKKRAAS